MVRQITEDLPQVEAGSEEIRKFIEDTQRITQRRFTAKKKILIVLKGFCRHAPIRDIYHREVIRPCIYYTWLKAFMEAGKERLTRDTTRADVQEKRRENARLKKLAAELSFQVEVLKKQPYRVCNKREIYQMSAEGKAEIITLVNQSGLPRVMALARY